MAGVDPGVNTTGSTSFPSLPPITPTDIYPTIATSLDTSQSLATLTDSTVQGVFLEKYACIDYSVNTSAETGTLATTAPSSSGNGNLVVCSPGNGTLPCSPRNETVSPLPNSPGSGVKPGIVAAIVVPVAVVVAILAFITAVLFLRRKPRQRYQDDHQGMKLRRRDSPVLATAIARLEGPKRQQQALLEDHLPQAVDDRSITTKASSLRTFIEQHVENFYREAKISSSATLDETLRAVNTDHLPRSLPVLMSDPRNQMLVIKHCIAFLTLSSLSAAGDPQTTFLPRELVAFVHNAGLRRRNDDRKFASPYPVKIVLSVLRSLS